MHCVEYAQHNAQNQGFKIFRNILLQPINISAEMTLDVNCRHVKMGLLKEVLPITHTIHVF